MPKFNKRVFGSHVDPKIIKVFKRLGAGGFKTEADLNKGLKQGDGGAQRDGAADAKILEQQIPSFEKYLGDRTPFTRMWCAVNIRDSGSADKDSDTLVFSVNENRENSYTTNPLSSVLGSEKTGNIRYVSQLSEELGKGNPYVKPAAGITSVTSKTQGALGALQHTTVEFMVHNKYDFENIFLPYFMRPGAIVCVDYGWSTDKGVGLYDPLEQLKDKPLDMSDFDKYIYDEDTGWINRKENFGTVNTTMGNVTNYSANMNNDGSFQCSIEIVSRNAGLLEKELDNENGLRFIFSNVLDDLIITALGVADPSVKATFTNKSVDQIKKIIDQEDPDKATEQYNNYLQQIDFGQQLNPDSKGGVRRDNEAFNIIGDFARKTGIFYQDIDNDTTITNNHLNQIVSNVEFFGMDKGLNDTSDFRSKETLYITYGRFEDMFLNNFVAGVIKEQKDEKGKIIRNQFNPNNEYVTQFDSRDVFIRWVQEIWDMQKLELRSNETLPCFIMPKYLGYKDTNSSWSYNNKIIINQENEGHYGIKKEMLEDFIENEFDVAAEQALFDCSLPRIEHHQYAFQTVMPLRELYISVPLIQHAFSTSNTVNDALQTIFDQVNDHSEKIWNIKMSTKSSDKNAITFTDANLMPPGTILSDKEDKKPVKGLIFDVFTDTSIVSNCDLKYSTPKGGLSNIIAISNTLNPQEYSTQELGALNNLLLLNKPKVKGGPDNQKFVSVRSLPIQGEVNEVISQPAINLKIDSVISQIKKSFTDADFNRRSQYDNTVDGENQNSTVSYYMDYQKSLDQRLNKVDSVVDKKGDFNPDDWETIGSFRQEKLDDARLRLFVTSGENTISPILPVELDLSVYGNRYLEIGDLYGLSYLPEHYKERTDFQIVGIQDNITPEGWTTSYTSILRVKPGKKQIVSLRSEDDKIGAGKKKRIDKNMYPEKFDQSNQKFSQSDNLQLFNERYVPKIDESKLILLSKEREFGSTATGINPADPEKTYRTLETKYFQDSYKISFEIYKYEFQPNLYPHICTGIEASWKKLSKFDNLAYAYALTKVVTKHFMPSRPVAIELGGNKTVTDYPDNYESIKNDNDFIYSLSSLGVTEMLFKVYFDDAYTNDVLLKNVIDTINNFLGDDDDIIRTHFERKMLKSAYETYVEDKTSPPGYTNIIAAKGWLSQYTDRLEADYQVRSYISDFGIRSYNLNDGETKGEYIYVVNRKFSENDQPFQNIRIPSSMLEQANITITEFCGELGQNWAELFNQLDIVKEDNDVNVADEIERETKARKERADELSKDIPITPRNTGGGLNNPQY